LAINVPYPWCSLKAKIGEIAMCSELCALELYWLKSKFARLRLRAASERGAALVEFAVTLPLLLLITTGICAFGFAINADMQLTNATSMGGQVLADARGATTDPCTTAVSTIVNAAPGLTPSNVNFSILFTSATGTQYGPFTGTGTSQTGEQGSGSSQLSCSTMISDGTFAQGMSAQITATYNYKLPFQPFFVGNGGVFGPYSLASQITEIVQ
jgi:Flp pilus assembly protein TadG